MLREGGIEDLPLSDAELDVALAMLVLHHVDDLEAAFVEIRRVIKPGGRLIVLDMVRHDRVDWAESMGHAHLGFGRDQLHQLAAGAGLRLQSWRTLVPVEAAQGPPLFVAVVSR